MKRNRKRESLRGGVIAKSLLVCLYFASVGLGYVWHKNQIYRLGDEVKRREAELLAIEKRNTVLAAQLAKWTSPAELEKQSQQYGLDLEAPQEGRVVRFREPGPEWDAAFARAQAVRQPQPASQPSNLLRVTRR